MTEPRLLAYVFGLCIFLTFGRVGSEMIRPDATADLDRMGWLAAQVFAGFSFLPLALYGAAALIGLICRSVGGIGTYRDTRLAFFWSGLAAGPVALLAQLAATATASATLGSALSGLVWLVLLCPMLAAAHEFRLIRVGAALMSLVAIAFALRAFG
ncbi:MAG: hypothetical protein AAF367_02740 [Pseudomonadota bacterium]